jgi:hypothetical protein
VEIKTWSESADEVVPERFRSRASVIIIDSGTTAQVIVVEQEEGLQVGSRFSHQGLVWQITGHRPHGRALVAEPVEV